VRVARPATGSQDHEVLLEREAEPAALDAAERTVDQRVTGRREAVAAGAGLGLGI
jgi:hypothetical protein